MPRARSAAGDWAWPRAMPPRKSKLCSLVADAAHGAAISCLYNTHACRTPPCSPCVQRSALLQRGTQHAKAQRGVPQRMSPPACQPERWPPAAVHRRHDCKERRGHRAHVHLLPLFSLVAPLAASRTRRRVWRPPLLAGALQCPDRQHNVHHGQQHCHANEKPHQLRIWEQILQRQLIQVFHCQQQWHSDEWQAWRGSDLCVRTHWYGKAMHGSLIPSVQPGHFCARMR